MFAGRLHIWRNKLLCRGPDSALPVPLCVLLPLNMFVEDLSSAVFCYFFSRPAYFLVTGAGAQPGRSVSGSEHVVVFSFVMPWVLWTSWGRYCMEGTQDSVSGPANRLDIQVLENSCYHRVSQGYTSVQGPQRRLNMEAKSSLIGQVVFFLLKHSRILFVKTSINLVTPFGMEQALTPPQLM